MKLRAALLALPLLSGLGCSSGPPAAVDGTIQGQSFPATSAVSSVGTLIDSLGPMAIIVASTSPGSCDLLSGNKREKGSQSLILGLGNVNFAEKMLFPPNGPNTFPVLDLSSPTPTISTDTTAVVVYTKTDANCVTTQPAVGVSGSVTLTSATDLEFEGTGDVKLNSGDHLTFTFDSTVCNGLAAGLKNAAAPTCP